MGIFELIFCTELKNFIRTQWVFTINGHVCHPFQHQNSVVANTPPFGQTGQATFPTDPTSKFCRSFCKNYSISTLSECKSTFQSGRPATNHQHTVVTIPGFNTLRMPTTSPFLTHSWVLRTDNWH